ncbi:MAG: hypothetical protein U0269_34955 [Polyangiales bacterium]
MKLRSLLVLSLFSLAACPPPAPSPDAQADAQPEAASPSDAQSDAGGSMDSSSDSAAPSDSGSDSSAAVCCVALAGTSQSTCDAVASLGRDRCNMLNGGTSCAWSAAASCNDGGASMPDASQSDGSRPDASADAAACCVARPGVSQSTCDAVASLGADRCNMLNGGASCMWQGGASCGDGGAVADSGVAGCCRARAGVSQSTCDAVASLGADRCNMLNGGASCSWLTGADCRVDAGPAPDAGCCAARPGVAQSTCDAVAPLGRDRCNMLNGGASCSWTCG